MKLTQVAPRSSSAWYCLTCPLRAAALSSNSSNVPSPPAHLLAPVTVYPPGSSFPVHLSTGLRMLCHVILAPLPEPKRPAITQQPKPLPIGPTAPPLTSRGLVFGEGRQEGKSELRRPWGQRRGQRKGRGHPWSQIFPRSSSTGRRK